ncbi:MAG: hypothetical protein EAZ53_07220 [Bacteroidetes bacterium]|nr:MAG: hypothetical protein EAZ53_07220 [Bacteroidota bacterium]
MERLIVKNFGPIKEIDIELKKTMVFIGTQSTGKSVLAKLISIFHSRRFVLGVSAFEELLSDYLIESFLENDSYIEFLGIYYHFKIEKKETVISFGDFKLQGISSELYNIHVQILENRNKAESFYDIEKKLFSDISFKEKTDKILNEINYPIYIPAERSFTSYAIGSLAGLIVNNIQIPKPILNFVAEFEKARAILKKINIGFLNASYEYREERDIIKIENNKEILLKYTSSGFQSTIPLILVIENNREIKNQAKLFVVEEPELNLFPDMQQKFLYILAQKCTNSNQDLQLSNKLIITTHSPYILTSLNNLLLAFQTAEKLGSEEEVSKIIPKKSWINPEEFAAYNLADGYASSIFDGETKMIAESLLDSASEIIMQDFYNLMELYKK